MNAVEIEEAVSKLIEAAFDAAEFPYAFLEAFGNKDATIRRLRSTGKNTTNKTDVEGEGVVAVLQRNNIHIASLPHCIGRETDLVDETMKRLADSPATTKHKAKFVLVTDGRVVHAEKLNSDEPPLVCEFAKLDDHFGYFLELAGISTVRQIRENAFDIKATGRLNRLYVELLRNNPDWDGDHAADAAACVELSRRTIPVAEIAAGVGQKPGVDVCGSGQTASSKAETGDRGRAGKVDRGELWRHVAERTWVLRRLGRFAEMESLQCTRNRRWQG
ncbi:type IIL restriction-modification enzyme MmeI [Neorhodopirellula pilleata]|nr:type IIL restriction-modification enzyme MmeI [Neorhodopirellula pilleata]